VHWLQWQGRDCSGSTDWQWNGNRLPKKNGEVNHET
jgi:hypothetical protein